MARVLHLITNLGQGGAERQLTYLSCGLVDLGWEVHVAYLETGIHGEINLGRLHEAGAITHAVTNRGSYDPLTPIRLWRLIRAVQPNVVQTWIPLMDIVGGCAALATGTPWVISERNTPNAFPGLRKMKVRRVLGRASRAVVSNSEAGNENWGEVVSDRVRRYVIANALPIEDIEAAAPIPDGDTGIPGNRSLVLFAGRLNAQKNIEVLLPALQRVVERSDAIAAVCGQGPGAAWVDAFVRDHGLEDRIRILGFVREPWSWMKRAAVFVSVSRHEGMPNAVMEAAAAGVALVLSEIPQHTSIFEPDSVFFTRADDPEAVAQAILGALDDRNVASDRASRARRTAERWSIRSAAERYAQVYADIGGAGAVS